MLHGRDVERATIDRLLTDARTSRSGALVLRGEAGVGKSALLSYAEQRATGFLLLHGLGVESESELAFAALHQLLRPVLSRIDRLPAPQAAALAGAFGLDSPHDGQPSDRFLIAVGALSLLAEVAEERPVLCLIDDAQWLDQSSADALTFVARRLEAEAVLLLFAARDDDGLTFPAAGLPERRLASLSPSAADALLHDSVAAGTVPSVRERLVEATGGNPLALLELPAELTEAQLGGREPLPDPLPLSRGVQRLFGERVDRLPEATRTMVLLAAAEETGDPAVVLGAAAVLGVEPGAVDAAEAAGLLAIGDGGVRFRHPLVRSAAYQGASFGQRRAAHLALARTLDGEGQADRRAWHRAAAAFGPDEDVAAELDRSAARAQRRRGYAAAAAALQRAAELTADEPARARRLAAAADAAWLAGRPEWTRSLLGQAGELDPSPLLRGEIERLRGVIELQSGIPQDAYAILAAAAAGLMAIAPRRALEVLVQAAEAASFSGDTARLVELGHLVESMQGPVEGGDTVTRLVVGLLAGTGRIMAGETAAGAELLRETAALAEGLDDPRWLAAGGRAALYVRDDATAHRLHGRAVERARALGAVGTLPSLLERLAATGIWAGQYATAAANAVEGLRLARETGQDEAAGHHMCHLAMIAAIRGDEDECRDYAGAALDLATTRQLRLLTGAATWALGRLELGLGRPEEALDRLLPLAGDGVGPGHPVAALAAVPDLVEAAARTGRAEAAAPVLTVFERWAGDTASPWALAMAAHCRGALAPAGEGGPHFDRARGLHEAANHPFEAARTELLHGEELRRARRRAHARVHLRSAMESFEQLGAVPWAARAQAELRASGETARRRDPSTADTLTPQERQIARFVAQGATNREVAAQLFLSPRTVDYHLHKVFTKLGITARAELIRLALPDTDGATTQ